MPAMMDIIINIFVFFSSGLIMLMALVQFIATKRRIENILSSVILFCLSLAQVQFLLIYVIREQQAPIFYFLHLTILFAGGTAGYLSVEFFYHEECKSRLRYFLHFLPAIAALALEIVIQILPEPMKSAVIRDMIVRDFTQGINPFALIRFAGLLHLLCYLSAYMVALFKNSPSFKAAMDDRISVFSILAILAVSVCLIVSQVLGIGAISRIALILLGLVSMCWYFIAFTNPQFFFLFQEGAGRKRYERSLIKDIDADEILSRLRTLMDEEKIFCDEDITLKAVAGELQITQHQLSELLNAKLNLNFKTFINTYRIEEAKRLLADEPERSIISIAFAVGFNSRSNFNTVFLKYTGHSPSLYRVQGV